MSTPSRPLPATSARTPSLPSIIRTTFWLTALSSTTRTRMSELANRPSSLLLRAARELCGVWTRRSEAAGDSTDGRIVDEDDGWIREEGPLDGEIGDGCFLDHAAVRVSISFE